MRGRRTAVVDAAATPQQGRSPARNDPPQRHSLGGRVRRAASGPAEERESWDLPQNVVEPRRARRCQVFSAMGIRAAVVATRSRSSGERMMTSLIFSCQRQLTWTRGIDLPVRLSESHRPPPRRAPAQGQMSRPSPTAQQPAPGAAPTVAATPSPPTLRGERSYLVSGGSLPPRRPASAEEARRIAALYGTEPLIAEAATEAAVHQRISSVSVVHLATSVSESDSPSIEAGQPQPEPSGGGEHVFTSDHMTLPRRPHPVRPLFPACL